MRHIISRRTLLGSGLALGAAGFLPTARACEFFTTTLRVTHPWTRATPADASFAVVSMKIDQVLENDRLIGVETPVATGAILAGGDASRGLNLSIQKGQELNLQESGLHVRLTGLTQPLLLGRTYPMQLVFERGGLLISELNVDY